MKTINRLIYRFIEDKFMHGCSNYNTLKVRKESRTKQQARAAFDKLGVPYAQGMTFYNPFTAFRFAKKIGFPLVIKPNVSGYSRGSYFPITNFKAFWKAALLVKLWWPGSIIEEYLYGRNYRVVVVKGEIMSVIRRYPPFIVGDGRSTIDILIDQENSKREEMGLFPVMHAIKKSARTIRYLKKQNLFLSSVPEKGKYVYLHNKIALAPGGIVETIDKRHVSEKNRDLFLKIQNAFNANIFGIDVIFEQGIECDYDTQKTIFLELNSRPYLKMHNYPRLGGRPNLDMYLARLNNLKPGDTGIF